MNKEKLLSNWQVLVQNGNFNNLEDWLIQDRILTPMQVETIKAAGSRHERMRELLSIIQRKPEEDVGNFFTSLQRADECLFSQLVSPSSGPYQVVEDSSTQPVSCGVPQRSILERILCCGGEKEEKKRKRRREKDEFEIVQTELKTWYSNNMKCIQPLPMCEWEEQDLEHIFTNLQVVEGKKSRPTDSSKKQSSRPCNDHEILKRIFKVTPPKRNICFIEGPAGIGKSTLCRQFAFLWSKDEYEIYEQHFDLVGILEARSLTKDFQKSFVEELFPENFRIPEKNICQHFETGKSLLIIDGVDELTADGKWAITQLLEGRFFRDVHLIITGRPESVRKFLRPAKLHLEVTGFSKMNAKEYIHKYFRNDENNYEEVLLDSLEDDRELSELMVNPFVTLLLCILVEEKGGEIPPNLSEIYHEVMWTICRKYVRKLQKQGDCSPDEEMLYNAARYVAYTGIRDNVFVFPENDLNSLCEDDLGFHLIKSGILSKDYTISRLHSNEFCYFPHRSFQEFFCWCYLDKMDLEEFEKEVLPLLPCDDLYLAPIYVTYAEYSKSTQLNRTREVLSYLFEIMALNDDCRSAHLTDDFIRDFLRYGKRSTLGSDFVDFLRIHLNKSYMFTRNICLVNNIRGFIHEPVQLAVCKMDLPPATHIDVSCVIPTSEPQPFRLGEHILLGFTKSNGVKMSVISCCSIRHASACLQKLRRLGVLTITVWPDALDDVHLQAFQQDLTSVENKINIVFVFLEDMYDDSRVPNFISLVKGYSSDKVKIQSITLKQTDYERFVKIPDHGFIIYPPDSCEIGTERRAFRISRSLQRECYDRFCPY